MHNNTLYNCLPDCKSGRTGGLNYSIRNKMPLFGTEKKTNKIISPLSSGINQILLKTTTQKN